MNAKEAAKSIAIGCGCLLIIATFCPFASLGAISVDYFRRGSGEALVVIIAAVAAIAFSALNIPLGTAAAGVVALLTTFNTYATIQQRLAEASIDLKGRLAGEVFRMSEAAPPISVGWGFLLMLVASIGIIVAGWVGVKASRQSASGVRVPPRLE